MYYNIRSGYDGKNYYRGCVLSVSNGEKTIINGLNFGK